MRKGVTNSQARGVHAPPVDIFENSDKAATWIASVLRNPFIDPSLDECAERLLLQLSAVGNSDGLLAGSLYFIRFTLCAEQYRFERNHALIEKADSFLLNAACIRYIEKEYGYGFKGVSAEEICESRLIGLHRVGTTSFILKFQTTVALKIIKPHYLDDPNIADATQRYKSEYRALFSEPSIIPEVYDSRERFIEMQFVAGPTLREFAVDLSTELAHRPQNGTGVRSVLQGLTRKYILKLEEEAAREVPLIEQIVFVVQQICSLLAGAAAKSIHHLDLSPDNIIIELGPNKAPVRVWLIDLGYNYLLYERLGSPSAFVHAHKYMAPELFKGAHRGEQVSGVGCDLYSLGVILLELLSYRDLHPRDIPYQLDRTWMSKPDFAGLIEQMIHSDPKIRSGRVYRKREKFYNVISERLSYAQEMFRSTGETSVTFRGGIVRALFPMNNIHSAFELRRREASTRPLSRRRGVDLVTRTRGETVRNLLRWSKVALIASFVTGLICMVLILEDVGLAEPLHYVGLWDVPLLGPLISISERINHWIGGSWQTRLPGRLVGLSFCIVATQYYFNILSLVPSLGLDRKTRFWMRCNSFSYSIPILFAVLVCPSAWPICSAFGVFVVFLNNHYCYLTAADIRNRLYSGKERERSSRVDDFLEQFDKWRSGILLYAITLSLLQFLFLTERLFDWSYFEDEWVYALAVTFPVNLLFLHFDASTRQAPMVRSGLRRLFSANINLVKQKNRARRRLASHG